MGSSWKGIEGNPTVYGDPAFSIYLRRAFLASAGYDREDLERPIVGIVNTSSDYNTCHRQMPEIVEAVKRGVNQAGGVPLAFPTISLHEHSAYPTSMLFRNLAAMDTEEMIRAQPMDAVVLLGGCDKTVPAQLMGAISAGVPFLSVVSGPMMTGYWRGQRLGACTDCRRFWALHRAGELSDEELQEVEAQLCFTGGTCMVMGTASTMACVTEALGLMLPGGATPPMASGARLTHAVATGRRAVAMARESAPATPCLTRESFLNAITVLSALSGSTNAIVHLLAIARRAGISLTLDDFDAVAQQVPLLVNCKPAGEGWVEDFHFAGGMPVLMKVLAPLLYLNAIAATGEPWETVLDRVAPPGDWQTMIRTLENPLGPTGSLAVLKGSLAPDGAVLKAAAATPELCQHRGPAIVFDGPKDLNRVDDPALNITPDHVMVLRNAGPIAAGMPEAGSMPIPKYLAAQGVKDMVRVSDARMSGTAYGTVVLHCAPEAAAGGPLALVDDGDEIELDLAGRRIDLRVSDEELAHRREYFQPPEKPARGWRRLYAYHVLQAHLGADLDFL